MGSVYIGYGIDITWQDLGKIFNMDVEFTTENRDEYIKNLVRNFANNPVRMSNNLCLKLSIVPYPHDYYLHKTHVAVGVFKYIHRFNEFSAEEKLSNIMQKKFYHDIFMKMFNQKREFKIIFDSCSNRSCLICK